MNGNEAFENDDRLSLQLRREARRSRPAFSAALHEQVLVAIQTASAPPPAATVRARRSSGTALSWAMTAAASIALLVALAIAFNSSRSPSPIPIASGGPASPGEEIGVQLPGAASPAKKDTPKIDAGDIDVAAEELANSASGIGDWVRSAAGESQWGGLDHDAQRALAAVAGPLPFDVTFSLASSDAD